MPVFSNIKKSIIGRLSFWIIIMSGVVFFTAAVTNYLFFSRIIERSAGDKTEMTMNYTISNIDHRLSRIATTINNVAMIINSGGLQVDSLNAAVTYIVANNPDIVGSAIAFEPNYFREKGYYYSPYAYESGDQILTKQLGNEDYDYFSMEWYAGTKTKKTGIWTNPYFDEGGGEILMCTYSAPMTDSNGQFMGVVTADISLNWLEELVENMKPYPDSYSFALHKSGAFFMQGHFFNTEANDFFSLAERNSLELLGRQMIAGLNGHLDVENVSGDPSTAYYAPIAGTEWSLAIVSSKRDILAEFNRVTLVITIIDILAILLLFAICRLIIGRMLKPLSEFAISAQEIAKGQFNAKLPDIRTEDQMKELRDSFDYMQNELLHYTESLASTAAAKEKIESELRIAHSIQMGLIPKSFPPFPNRSDVDIYAMLRPAKEVGGDLYDFFRDNNSLYFSIGDVSDKGIPAALYMAVVRSHFRSIATILRDPKAIIESLNRALSENNEESMFVTMIVGIMDLETGQLTYCNAGHNQPCIIRTDSEPSFINMKQSLPLGIIDSASYVDEEILLKPGDALLLYTDGLNEAENSGKEQYGNGRLIENLRWGHSANTREIIKRLEDSVEDFVAGASQSDDLTMLAIKYLGHTSEDGLKTRVWEFKTRIEEISRMQELLDEACEQMDVDPGRTMQINLALEEALTNVILYAYPQDGNEYSVIVKCSQTDTGLVFKIEDRGLPFNPLQMPEVNTDLPAEDRAIGGLGIHLIKQLMDSVEYAYADGKNILTMKKNL